MIRLSDRGVVSWWVGFAIALLVSTPAWLAWLDPRQDLWAADDAAIHMIRLHHVSWLIGEGVWFPRWVPDMFRGYGYPLLNYYAPASYYLGTMLRALVGLDVWDAFRGAGALAAASLAGGCYALVTCVWRRPSLGMFAALTVSYGPYAVQMNLFQRGNVPELLSLSFLPWLLTATWALWHADERGRVAWSVVGVAASGAGAVLSHNLTGMATAAVVALWVAFLAAADRRRWPRLTRMVAAGLLVAAITAFFWVPALAEARFVQLSRFQTPGLDYRQWLVDVDGLTARHQRPENRQSRTGPIDTHAHYPHQLLAPPKISLAQAGLGVLAVGTVMTALASGKRDPSTVAIVPLVGVALLCWFITFEEAAPLWKLTPVLPLFQFPWRLLGPLAICLATAAAGSLAIMQRAVEKRSPERATAMYAGIVGIATAGVLFNSLGDQQLNLAVTPPERFTVQAVLREEQDRGTGGTTGVAEFLPVNVVVPEYSAGNPRIGPVYDRLFPEADWLGDRLLPLSGELRFLEWRLTPLSLHVRVVNEGRDTARLAIRQLWFPGWRAWLDGRPHPIATAPHVSEQQASLGFMVVELPPGEHSLGIAFGPTTVRLAATAASLVGLALVAGVLWWASGWSPRGTLLCAAMISLITIAGWRTVRPVLGTEQGEVGLVVNVAEEARGGRAVVGAPSGARLGPDAFVDVRQLTVLDATDPDRGYAGTSTRQLLYSHPPASVAVRLTLPKADSVWFQASLALDPATWSAAEGDGVAFQLWIEEEGDPESARSLLEKVVNPRATAEQRRWVPVSTDLTAWAGKDVRLTLRTLPRSDPSHDWAGWGNAVVVARKTSRLAPANGVG